MIHAGSEAQRGGREVLAETRRSLYRILAEDERPATSRGRVPARETPPRAPVRYSGSCEPRRDPAGSHDSRDALTCADRRDGVVDRLPPALQLRDYGLLWIAILVNGLGAQMVAVAVGWQVYAIHRDPLDLGLIGLAEFVPLLGARAARRASSRTGSRAGSCSRSRWRSRSR